MIFMIIPITSSEWLKGIYSRGCSVEFGGLRMVRPTFQLALRRYQPQTVAGASWRVFCQFVSNQFISYLLFVAVSFQTGLEVPRSLCPRV